MLRKLELTETMIGDAGLVALTTCLQLRYLYISKCFTVTDDGVTPILASLQLYEFDVSFCNLVTKKLKIFIYSNR